MRFNTMGGRRYSRACVLFVAFGALNLLWGAEAERQAGPRPAITSLPQLPAPLHDALQSKEFDASVKLIDALLAEKGTTFKDYLLYLKGRAQLELNQLDPAFETFTRQEKEFPNSRWLARARFGKAAVLTKRRNYQAAGAIYKTEIERLLSSGRKDELTTIYLEFADRYFEGIPEQGPTSTKKPDYTQALTYYTQALDLRPSLALRQKIELRIARCQVELNQLPPGIAAYEQFLKNYAGKDTPPADRASAAFESEARYQLGRAQLAAGQPAEARKTWQDFLSGAAAKAGVADHVTEATYRLAHTYGVPAPPTVGDLELGVAALEKFVKLFPKSPLAPQAEFEIAQSQIHHGRYEQAVATLKALIANPAYAKATQVPSAWNLLGQSYAAQKRFAEAIAAWREFLDKFPTDPNWSNVQRGIIDNEFATAADERREKHFAAARKLWETFLNKYPLDARAPLILFQFGQMEFDEAVQAAKPAAANVAERAKPDDAAKDAPKEAPAVPAVADPAAANKLFAAAIDDWNRLVSKYPETNEASQAAYMIGVTLEERLGKLAEALEAYKKVTGQFQNHAQQRIANLTAKQLEIITERKFRSNEKPRIKLSTRNLENVSVKLYRIDMTDYFRKMHLASGVESLDIALIDPDKSWEQKTADYAKYRRIEQQVEIPVEGPGVTAVTVTSDALEATTMIVVSDIDIIVKSSRNELFVFAENMLTGKPAETVSLLLSDGSKVFAEAATGKDGILQKKFDELKTVNDLRVFAVREGHAASSLVSLEGLQFAVGLSPKGYLYTDRPAYRAGQLVNLKGLIRWVANDRYTFKVGEKYQLDLYDSRGRVLHTETVALSEFGTFAAHFALPGTAPQGDYRVHLFQPGREQSYETSFQVHEYQLEPIQLTIDLPRKVYYRGEQVQGKLKLQYYYGTPLAGRTIQYRLSDDRLYTAETDVKGEVAFDLPTQRYSESQPLRLVAVYPERNLAIGETLYLATRGFQIGVSTLRNVYIAGETFDASVSVTDPAGKPLGAELKIDVLEQTKTAGKTGERLVETQEVKADGKTGEGRRTLRIEKAGRYTLRAQGTDRFGNPVSGSTTVLISGDDDAVRLRILSDKHHYKVGDTGKVQLHWRDKPALALVTFEGAEVLGYRLVELKTGSNAFDVALDEKLAPNFELSVAVMQQDKFHQARSDFRVNRELRIALQTENTTLKPGAEMKVDVTVTDAQGKPVSAELTLGLIQKNLLQRFPDQRGAIDQFFNGGLRQVSVRAMTSCTFRYTPRTRPINAFLLAEADRQTVVAQEAAAKGATAQQLMEDAKAQLGDQSQAEALAESDADVKDAEAKDMDDPEVRFGLQQQTAPNGETAPAPINGPVSGAKPQSKTPESRKAGGESADRMRRSGIKLSPRAEGDGNRLGRPNAAGGAGSGKGNLGLDKNFAYGGTSSVTSLGVDLLDRPGIDSFMFNSNSDSSSKLSLIIRQHQELSFDPGITPQLQQKSLELLSRSTDGTIVALNGRGEVQVVNGWGVAALQKIAKDGGLEILPDMSSAETGYWNPRIVTDKVGKATIVLRLPDRSTAWTLQSKGINAETLAGQAELELITRKDLFAEMKTPLAFTAGDKADVLVEVHNLVLKAGTIDVAFKTTIGDKITTLKKTINVKQTGIEELSFPVEIGEEAAAVFELTVTGAPPVADRKPGDAARQELKDASERTVPINPYGLPVFATASGTAAQNTTVFISHAPNLAVHQPKLELIIGPSVNRTLLDAVLGSSASLYERAAAQPQSGLERAISDVLGGVSLLKMIGQTRTADTPEGQALAGKIQAGLSLLVSGQRDDGGWSWAGQPATEKSDRYTTSRVLWALAVARRAGFAVPQPLFDKGVQNLTTAFAASSESDHEGKAIILHGLAEAGAADFAHANRLYRSRNVLSASGLLHVALTLIRLDRQSMAKELLDLAQPKIPVAPPDATKAAKDAALVGCIPWMQTGVELRGLYLMALNEAEPASTVAPKLADWLMAARVGTRWIPEKANGPALVALADWFGRTKRAPEKYTLTIYANEKLVTKLDIDPAKEPSRTVPVPDRLLVAGKPQRINIDIEGRGQFSYSAVLSGFVSADKLQNVNNEWELQRQYEPAQRMLDGETIPRGFSVLAGGYTGFQNKLTQLPLGERGEVTIHVWRQRVTGAKDEQLDYLVLTESIPAGASVLTDSIKGKFELYEIAPGSITFYLGDRPYPGTIQFTLVGYLPGTYRNAPCVVRSFYQPERIAVAKGLPLEALPRGVKSKDEYKLTPQELYEFGKRLSAKRDYKPAAQYLSQLFKNYRLQDNYYREVVQWLFQAALASNDFGDIVQYFEIIKEKFSDIEVPFESILKVGQAYIEMAEYERGYLVYRATAEASFLRESQIAGFLDERGEFLRSVQVMERLLHEYPAESYIATATYALSQEVYGKAPEAAQNQKLRDANVTRVDLLATAIHMLDHFLSTWPSDPAADQASFSLANALLDMEQFAAAVARCKKFAERYPASKLLDSFWYIIGYSQFAQGQDAAALEMVKKVADMKRLDPATGVEVAAVNKWQAVYIMGQIYHSLGQPAKAITEYERVKDRFADAVEAIDFFTHKAISLPEVTTVKPGEPAKLPLKFRNVAAANIKVYRIDLLKFGLLQRNLSRITAINLAGIRPYHDLALNLGDGKDYKDRERPLELPLKEEGAYLVVCQGADLYASGLVLVTPLALEVQEDAPSGRVRVTVKNTVDDKYAHGVHVKVIGSANDQFVSGPTDLRGIFVADGIQGTSTVIAKTGSNRYAFHRGKTYLGQPPQPANASAPANQPPAADAKKAQGKDQLLDNLKGDNGFIQQEQRMNYRNLLRNKTQGVEAKSAF